MTDNICQENGFWVIQPELEYPKYFGYHPKSGQKAKQFGYERVSRSLQARKEG